MSRCYLDANFLFVHLRHRSPSSDPRVEQWRRRVDDAREDDIPAISGLVMDELAYRLILAWLRDRGETDPLSAYRRDARAMTRSMAGRLNRVWAKLDAMRLSLIPTDEAVVKRAQLMMARPGLAPRDAFHAAHAIEGSCSVIVSSDSAFDAVRSLRRVGP